MDSFRAKEEPCGSHSVKKKLWNWERVRVSSAL